MGHGIIGLQAPSKGLGHAVLVIHVLLGILNDVPGVHFRDVITVWIWNLLLLLNGQVGRLCRLWLLLLLLLPRHKPT